MKSLNLFKLTAEAAVQIEAVKSWIDNADTLEEAKKNACYGVGFVDCFITMSNTLICMENNDITAQLDTLENSWKADIYHAMSQAAGRFRDTGLLLEYAAKRDAYREASED